MRSFGGSCSRGIRGVGVGLRVGRVGSWMLRGVCVSGGGRSRGWGGRIVGRGGLWR